MCNLAPQARSINYAMSQDPRSFALAESVWDGVVGAYGGKALNEPAFAGNTYFDNAALYAGGGTADTKFLNTYFQTGLIGAGPGGCGTNNSKGRAEILKKTSQDWVPVTWIMKYLDEAASKIAAGGTANVALAKTAYDYVAGAYFGCGENNPVALPTTPNITRREDPPAGGPHLLDPGQHGAEALEQLRPAGDCGEHHEPRHQGRQRDEGAQRGPHRVRHQRDQGRHPHRLLPGHPPVHRQAHPRRPPARQRDGWLDEADGDHQPCDQHRRDRLRCEPDRQGGDRLLEEFGLHRAGGRRAQVRERLRAAPVLQHRRQPVVQLQGSQHPA